MKPPDCVAIRVSNAACENCGKEYPRSRISQHFCSSKYRAESWRKEHVEVFHSEDGRKRITIVTK